MKIRNIFLTITIILSISLLCGCSKNNDYSKNIDILDTQVDYFVIKDRKIYITKDIKDFTLQFKGLGCKIKPKYDEEIDIDTIKENNDIFVNSNGEKTIECYTSDDYNNIEVFMYTYEKDQKNPNEIYFMSIRSYGDPCDIVMDNKKLSIGKNPSSLDDVLNIMGNNYEIEKSISSDSKYYNYKIEGVEYSAFIDEDNLLKSLSLNF